MDRAPAGRLGRLAAATAAVLALGFQGDAAHAAWSAPLTISPIGQPVSDPRVGFDPDGNARIDWGLANVRREADGTLGSLVTGCAGGSFGMDRDGDAIFVEAGTPARTCSVHSDDTIGPTQDISPDNGRAARTATLAVDHLGRTAFAWDITGWRIQARAMTRAGNLLPIQTLSPLGEIAQDPKVAIDPSADAYVVWFSRPRDDTGPSHAYGRALSRLGTVGPLDTLGVGGTFVDVAMDREGNAAVIWYGPTGLEGRMRFADGTLGPLLTLSASAGCCDANVEMTPGGATTFMWRTMAGQIQLRRMSPAGALAPTRTIPTGGVIWPDFELDGAGNAYVIWFEIVGGLQQIRTTRMAPNGTLGPIETLSDRRSFTPDIAVTPEGTAIAAWERDFVSTGDRVQISVGP